MNVQSIINRARRLWYISSNQYTDTEALEDFNIVRKKLGKVINQRVDEDFFFDILTTDLIANQSEYNLFDDTNDIVVDKLQDVYVKYDATAAQHTKATLVDKDSLDKDLNWYAENQPQSNPIYYVADESVFVYPEGTAVTDWLQYHATLKLNDLLITDEEEAILIDAPELLADGMLPYIYQKRGLLNEKNDAKVSYENSVSEYIELLSDRISTTQEIETPEDSLTYYE